MKVSIKDYVQILNEIEEIRKAIRHKRLSRIEIKEYRKFTRKLSWLAAGTRSDLSYTVLNRLQKNKTATITDLHNRDEVLKKVKTQGS